MFIIVLHHFVVYSQLKYPGNVFSLRNLFLDELSIGGKIGVNLFILITGYFLYNSRFKLERVINIWSQTLFYSVSLFIFALIVLPLLRHGTFEVSIPQLLEAFLPITYQKYWFISIYIIIVLMSPFLNQLIKNISQKHFTTLLVIFFFFFSVSPFLTNMISKYGVVERLPWLITVYLTGAFIKKYEFLFHRTKRYFIICSLSLIFIIMLVLFVNKYNSVSENPYNLSSLLEASQPWTILFSITLFLIFLNWNIPYNNVINSISSTTLGIYLIHEHQYIRSILWEKFAASQVHDSTGLTFVIKSIMVVLLIFILCIAIEKIRKMIFDTFFQKTITSFSARISSIYYRL